MIERWTNKPASNTRWIIFDTWV